MNIFAVKIWDDERKRCTFYTVQWDGASDNETDKFFAKYENKPGFEKVSQQLLSFILLSIGDDHGAVDALFNRFENEVTGLLVQGKVRLGEFTYYYPSFPLRLYALKITEEIVVLFNGGEKDGQTNQTSSLNVKWTEACQFATRILEALRTGELMIGEPHRKLTDNIGGEEIIL
ncbi:MAG: hypothetical protein NTX61_08735 [Bacteroidetes bacterium]|nr:hypothetical protein [Bacteroidota bacterium]